MANYSALQVSSKQPSTSHPSQENDPYPDLVLSYSNLFRIFYNHPPSLDTVNIANAYVECKQLLHLADLYDALSVIGPRIDHHLLRFHSRLWKQIAKYPPSYLKLGFLARSKAIYSEALIHVIGQWPAGAPQLRGQVSQALWELIEDKVAELQDVTARVEARLFRLTLTTPRGDRVGPHSAWLDWLAVSLFRHWILENLTPPPAPILKSSMTTTAAQPGRGPSSSSTTRISSRSILPHRHRTSSSSRSAAAPTPSAPPPPFNISNTYALLAAGGTAYLPHAEIKAFLKLHPDTYSRENLRRFERRGGMGRGDGGGGIWFA
ncbi:hypothetical protein P152DRAFT_30530 [Eremomyces bilateralis CBS 781.70]|uniref:Uncharacterized protein n=1 Tax=Eremomyces bilateralis CBS 781.70 TaxID=1392243 RepID=A0A6G1G2M4_9PEZI|nr:uncharacterized protein P152DRAFT_30530 [Eremomyces bilateralis CBS 781.70]KAF1812268.1 hypothetical protein P152DRAFT_30530 [Eremomyces bilateralis CBS 781.70]